MTGAEHATRPPAQSARPASFGARVKRLRARAEAGSPEAWFVLASLLEDGLRDRRGRQRVAPDFGAAFRVYRDAALGGCRGAWGNVGVCYDSGTGVRRNITRARECYHREWKLHHSGAYNLGTWYRDRGRYREAYRWYERAVEGADGDALVTMGYCVYYGIGVARDSARAMHLWRRVDDTPFVTEFGREEARYLRAVALLDRGRQRDVAAAVILLQRANGDEDYPEADVILEQVDADGEVVPCRCRRHRYRDTLGQAHCELHRARGRRPVRR